MTLRAPASAPRANVYPFLKTATKMRDFPTFLASETSSRSSLAVPRRQITQGEMRSIASKSIFLTQSTGANGRSPCPTALPSAATIPPGIQDGQVLRLRGAGDTRARGGPTGDALIEVRVRSHPLFRRDGDYIRLELAVSLQQAVLGGAVTVPTPSGSVNSVILARSTSGKVLRLRGGGAAGRW